MLGLASVYTHTHASAATVQEQILCMPQQQFALLINGVSAGVIKHFLKLFPHPFKGQYQRPYSHYQSRLQFMARLFPPL